MKFCIFSCITLHFKELNDKTVSKTTLCMQSYLNTTSIKKDDQRINFVSSNFLSYDIHTGDLASAPHPLLWWGMTRRKKENVKSHAFERFQLSLFDLEWEYIKPALCILLLQNSVLNWILHENHKLVWTIFLFWIHCTLLFIILLLELK